MNPVPDQVWYKVREQVLRQVWSQVSLQVDNESSPGSREQVLRQVWSQVSLQVNGQVYDQVYHKARTKP